MKQFIVSLVAAILRALLPWLFDKAKRTQEESKPDPRKDRLNEQIREHWKDP